MTVPRNANDKKWQWLEMQMIKSENETWNATDKKITEAWNANDKKWQRLEMQMIKSNRDLKCNW